jgi:hypothetical protein
MVAPWSWDNIKMLIFPYLGFARLAWVLLDQRVPSFSKYLIAFILFFSGFVAIEVTLSPPMQRGLTIYQVKNIAEMAGALKDLPKEAVIASATNHNHGLTYFGRIRAVGYDGHLWSHGVDFQRRMDLLNQLMKPQAGADLTRLAHELGATHVIWGQDERDIFQIEPAWPATFKNVSRVASIKVFEVPK